MLVNGHNIWVEQYGLENGPVVVLLHHGLGSVKAWRRQAKVLAEAGYHVVAYDRWGYGGSDARPKLDLPTFSVVGHSDGGTIALYFAAQYPRLVSCLVTVAAHIYVEPKMESGILGIKQEFETDEHFRMGIQYAHCEKYEAVFYNWFDGWNRIEHRSWDMCPILGMIKCPSLIVQGDRDEHATPQHARDIADSIQGSELWLIPEAGHMLPQENTSVFNPGLLQFLNQYRAGE
jgi:pimeloyl-ACP methyl ester carboxylesterase